MPVMMTFSSTVERCGKTRARPMARIEMGIAASITCPTFSPEYAEATVNTTQRKTPQPIELTQRSIGWGVFLCVVFTVASAYSGLKVGQVMEAAIPISILAIGLARV